MWCNVLCQSNICILGSLLDQIRFFKDGSKCLPQVMHVSLDVHIPVKVRLHTDKTNQTSLEVKTWFPNYPYVAGFKRGHTLRLYVKSVGYMNGMGWIHWVGNSGVQHDWWTVMSHCVSWQTVFGWDLAQWVEQTGAERRNATWGKCSCSKLPQRNQLMWASEESFPPATLGENCIVLFVLMHVRTGRKLDTDTHTQS